MNARDVVGIKGVRMLKKVDVTDFILWKKGDSDHFTGYANFFGLKQYKCIIKKTPRSFIVLLKIDNKWEPVGKFYPYNKPQKVRADKVYECIGEIWMPHHTFHLLKDGNRFIGI